MLDPTGKATMFGAVGFSALAIGLNMLCAPILFRKITDLKSNVENGMVEFKTISDEAFAEMASLRKKLPAPSRTVRQANGQFSDFQSGGVTWDSSGFPVSASGGSDRAIDPLEDSRCPSGPPGLPGQDGANGLDGTPGLDGEPGFDGNALGGQIDDEGCIVCPQGPQGDEGPPGPSGAPGPKGWAGTDGNPGSDGWPGPVGPRGFKGNEGTAGEAGPKGQPGRPAPGGKGEPGPTGARGPIGRAGPQGPSGKPGYKAGLPGPEGKMGPAGTDGKPGTDGVEGRKGDPGIAGGDAKYCPCPKEIFRTTQQFPNPTFNPGFNGVESPAWNGQPAWNGPGAQTWSNKKK